jgi:hypothetical protein
LDDDDDGAVQYPQQGTQGKGGTVGSEGKGGGKGATAIEELYAAIGATDHNPPPEFGPTEQPITVDMLFLGVWGFRSLVPDCRPLYVRVDNGVTQSLWLCLGSADGCDAEAGADLEDIPFKKIKKIM